VEDTYIQIIDDILPDRVNKKIIYNLITKNYFKISHDNINTIEDIHFYLTEDGKDMGFNFYSFNKETNVFLNSPISTYADIIFSKIKQKINFNIKDLVRCNWNYYTKNSETNLHRDKNEKNYISILYNLHTNDGGTEINNVFYPSISGQAILFKSNQLHKGFGPKSIKSRFNLNIVAEI